MLLHTTTDSFSLPFQPRTLGMTGKSYHTEQAIIKYQSCQGTHGAGGAQTHYLPFSLKPMI